jgi:hypothetical protein
MNPNDKSESDKAVRWSAWLDHSGVVCVDRTGQEWPYEIITIPKGENEQLTGRDDPRLRPPRFEGQGIATPWLNRLSMADALRCVAKEVRQDSQPLRTLRLRVQYRFLRALEIPPSARQVVMLFVEIYKGLNLSWRCMWSNDPSSATRLSDGADSQKPGNPDSLERDVR